MRIKYSFNRKRIILAAIFSVISRKLYLYLRIKTKIRYLYMELQCRIMEDMYMMALNPM